MNRRADTASHGWAVFRLFLAAVGSVPMLPTVRDRVHADNDGGDSAALPRAQLRGGLACPRGLLVKRPFTLSCATIQPHFSPRFIKHESLIATRTTCLGYRAPVDPAGDYECIRAPLAPAAARESHSSHFRVLFDNRRQHCSLSSRGARLSAKQSSSRMEKERVICAGARASA